MSAVQDYTLPPPEATPPCPPVTPALPKTRAATLARAVLRTLVYADLFDYPLTAAELTHYLIGGAATPAEVATILAAPPPTLTPYLAERAGFYYLRGRDEVLAKRRERRAVSARLWPRAYRYARLLRHLPFVRMIAVTGALAVDNVGANADIDLLVISAPGRVWICRRLLILAVRAIRILGDEICPNFILAADSLALPQHDLFTAHELAQMRPLAGHAVYRAMLARNGWMASHLPNAGPWPAQADTAPPPAALGITRQAERLLRAPRFDRWERVELGRLRRKLGPAPPGDDEVACTPSQCKGHTGHYRAQVLRRYEARLAALTGGSRLPES